MDWLKQYSIDCWRKGWIQGGWEGRKWLPPSEVRISLCSTRPVLVMLWGQSWEDCCEMGWSVYGVFEGKAGMGWSVYGVFEGKAGKIAVRWGGVCMGSLRAKLGRLLWDGVECVWGLWGQSWGRLLWDGVECVWADMGETVVRWGGVCLGALRADMGRLLWDGVECVWALWGQTWGRLLWDGVECVWALWGQTWGRLLWDGVECVWADMGETVVRWGGVCLGALRADMGETVVRWGGVCLGALRAMTPSGAFGHFEGYDTIWSIWALWGLWCHLEHLGTFRAMMPSGAKTTLETLTNFLGQLWSVSWRSVAGWICLRSLCCGWDLRSVILKVCFI